MVINVRNVVSIKKDKTAHLFPNAIMISTDDKKVGSIEKQISTIFAA